MKRIGDTGLVRMSWLEAQPLLTLLFQRGYRWDKIQGGGELWSPCGEHCVGERYEGCLWLEESVLNGWADENSYLVVKHPDNLFQLNQGQS